MSAAPLLPFPPGCRVGTLLRREKRFSMAVMLDGTLQWAHTNNTGSMLGLLRPGSPILLSPAANPARKLAWTVEAVDLNFGNLGGSLGGPPHWVGINTATPNRFLRAAFCAGLLPWAQGYTTLRLEAVHEDSRLDAVLSDPDKPRLWVECKNVTLVEDGVAAFPDAITERGRKHLETLRRIVRNGERAAMLYLVQRGDGRCFAPADYIDPLYAACFYEALEDGVEAYAHIARVDERGIFPEGTLPHKSRWGE